jgi:hypothetical protein
MNRLGEALRAPGIRPRIAIWTAGVVAALVLLFLARFRPSWPWFSLWVFGLLGGFGVLSLPGVRKSLNLSWFGVTFLTLLGVVCFDLYLFHVETHRQRSERLEFRGVFFEARGQPIRVGVGYPGLDVRLEGSLFDFDRWSLDLEQTGPGRYVIRNLKQVDMLRTPARVWWKPWGRVRAPAMGGVLGRGVSTLTDSTPGHDPLTLRLLAEGEAGVLAWEGSRAPLSLDNPLLERRLSRRLAAGVLLADLDWDSIPDRETAEDLVLTRVRPGASLGRIRLRLPEYRLVSRSRGERFHADSLPSVQEGDTVWVSSRGKSWGFAVTRVSGLSRVAAPTAIHFVRRPRPTGWALPSSEVCGDQAHRCAVLSTRTLPPPQPHFDLGGFGLDTARYSVLARLETDREEVRLVGADFRTHFGYGDLKPVQALPARDGIPGAGILVRVHRAAQGQQSAVVITVSSLFFLILGALVTISGDPALWRRRKVTSPSISAAWAFVNLFLIFLGIRLALGLRVAYSPPFYDRAAATAVGLWITFALMMVALGRWSSWAPAFWRLVRRLERPVSRLFLPGVNGSDAPEERENVPLEEQPAHDPEPSPYRIRDRARSVIGLVFMLSSLGILLWQRPEAAPSILVAATGIGAWLAMGISRRRGHSAILNRIPLGVITAEGEREEPSLALGMAAGASVILALAIHAPWMALIPVLVLLVLFGVNFAMERWGPMKSPRRRARALYVLILLFLELGILALFPWPKESSGVLLALGCVGALLLERRSARGSQVPVSLLEHAYAGFVSVGEAVFSGVGWVGVLLILGALAFLSAQAIPPFVRFALVFMLFLLAIRAGLACRKVLDRGERRGQIEALGLLVIPLGVLLVFMLFDFGLGLVFFAPMFLTVLLSARIDRLPGVLMAGSAGVLVFIGLVAWSVLNPSLDSLRGAKDVPTFSTEFQEVGNGLVDLLRRAGMRGPLTRASIRSIAASQPELLEEALAYAGPSEALFAAAPSRDQVWGGRAYAASDFTGTGFAGTAILGRGVPTAVSYAENSYSVYILSEHGALGGLAVLLAYLALLLVVGVWIYRVHETIQDTPLGLAALAMTVGGVFWLVLPALYVAASNLALVPLTGQNMPFLGLNSWADVVLVSGLATGIVFGLSSVEDTEMRGEIP